MVPFFNMFSISTCIISVCSWTICGVWGTLVRVRFFRKGILNTFLIYRISGSFVSISHTSKKCFNVPASGKFGAFLAENKLFIHGWTLRISSIGIIGENNMMKKVSFVFIFTLESTASTSCWAVVSVEYFLPQFPIFFVEEEFRMLPFITPPRCFWRAIPKGLLFFLALFSKYFNGLFFLFSWNHQVFAKLFPNKFLSSCCNKSASSLNISLDCCVGQLRAAKMLYLLKYVM